MNIAKLLFYEVRFLFIEQIPVFSYKQKFVSLFGEYYFLFGNFYLIHVSRELF